MTDAKWTARLCSQSQQREKDHRNPFQRDKARVLHSAAFRRLQAKTQVMSVGTSDFHRTRLTHSLEASQIGQGIVGQLQLKQAELAQFIGLDTPLIETLCLAHDIGHPPFGHGGEVALHYMMRHNGGFEGNGQTFRIVTQLEPYTAENGMNLCRRTLLGLIKYPVFISDIQPKYHFDNVDDFKQLKADLWHPPKGLFNTDKDMYDWVIAPFSESDRTLLSSLQVRNGMTKSQYKSVDCSVMELADDIAYGVHDLEDAITMGIIHQQLFDDEMAEPLQKIEHAWFAQDYKSLSNRLFSQHHYERKDAIGSLVNYLVTAIELQSVFGFEDPLLAYNAVMKPAAKNALDLFKRFVYRHVIKTPQIQRHEYRGQQVIMQLFEAFKSDPTRLLPNNTAMRWQQAGSPESKHRVLCDYLSGMTDAYAMRMYHALFLPE